MLPLNMSFLGLITQFRFHAAVRSQETCCRPCPTRQAFGSRKTNSMTRELGLEQDFPRIRLMSHVMGL